jgi:hypothetical protein
MIIGRIKGPSDRIGWQGKQGSPAVGDQREAVAATWRHRGRWRYNIVAAATPVTDRDNDQQPGSGGGSSGVPAPHPGAQDKSGEVEVETWDAIRSRRNVRSYSQRAIAPQDLDRILEAARRTPSAGNQQAWDFVVCTDPEQLTQLASVGPAAGHVASSGGDDRAGGPTPR